jgi:hypothetical protein
MDMGSNDDKISPSCFKIALDSICYCHVTTAITKKWNRCLLLKSHLKACKFTNLMWTAIGNLWLETILTAGLLLKNSNLQDHRLYTYTDIQLYWLWTFRKKIGGRGRGTETRKCTRKLCGISKLAAEVSLSYEHTCTHTRAHRCLWKLIHTDSDKFLSVSRI